jgi:hypothetical protein
MQSSTILGFPDFTAPLVRKGSNFESLFMRPFAPCFAEVAAGPQVYSRGHREVIVPVFLGLPVPQAY